MCYKTEGQGLDLGHRPPKADYIRFERFRSLDAVSGIPTCAMESMKSSGLNDGDRSRLRILATCLY